MKKRHAAFLLIVGVVVAPFAHPAAHAEVTDALPADVAAAIGALEPGEMTTVSVTLVDRADLSNVAGLSRKQRPGAVAQALEATATASQRPLQARLEQLRRVGEVDEAQSFWVYNGIMVTATAAAITEIAGRTDVASIELPPTIQPAGTFAPADVEPNVSIVGAPALWTQGITGDGVVVANLDTGVHRSHPDLVDNYRGGANSWFDPYGQHTTPFDADGHGSATMSVIAGRDADGTAIGVAPDATWIAAKVFDDSGAGSAAAIHASFQWILDPDGDPQTPDAPDVVNNSWTNASGGCDTEFEQDLAALRVAGILPVFAAGNAGPGSASSRSPGNLADAFAVGAVDNADAIATDSSRGPSACVDDPQFPELVAPGVSIKAADNVGTYWSPSGTSLAAPHVAGALALLLQAHPVIDSSAQEEALLSGAVDLGAGGSDPVFGAGRVDVAASLVWLDQHPPNQPPQASFSVRTKKDTATFDAGGSTDADGVIVSYDWDFGDGSSGSGSQVTHQFAKGATYEVVLTVTDDGGAVGVATDTVTFGGKGKPKR